MRFSVLSTLSALILGIASSISVSATAGEQKVEGSAQAHTKPQDAIENSFAQQMHFESGINYQNKYAVTCLIYTYKRNWLSVHITSFTTYKVDRCNPNKFLSTTASSATAQLAAFQPIDFITMAGPHIQMTDRNQTPVQVPYVYVGEMKYSPMTEIRIGIIDLIAHYQMTKVWAKNIQIYTPLPTVGDLDITWFPGSRVYKIIDDSGRVFVMTNMVAEATFKNENDILEAANNLGSVLALPKGWRFETQDIKEILTLKMSKFSNIPVLRMQDQFGNLYIEFYQKII